MDYQNKDKIKSALVSSAGLLVKASKSPDESLGQLFYDVQTKRLFGDGKTFVDLIPRKRSQAILKEYKLAKQDPSFDLSEFINRHFYEFSPGGANKVQPIHSETARERVTELWPQLKRRNRKNRGSLLALPYEYIVPGGRFSEQFYWDSYFVMLGLAADDQWQILDKMMENYIFMIQKFGFIPTANRNYFTSRSQPPFFSHMVRLLATKKGKKQVYFEYLPYLLSEYRFWTKGRGRLMRDSSGSPAFQRAVRLPNDTIVNRYFDNKVTPRPESLSEDIVTATDLAGKDRDKVFLDLRAAAESGWDFSSRWFRDPNDIRTIYTTNIVPVDLNCLLYDLEVLLGEIYGMMGQGLLKNKFQKLANKRRDAIQTYCWNDEEGYYYDYDFRLDRQTDSLHVAAIFTLWSGIATEEQAKRVADRLERDFLKPGGLVTTTLQTGQQWDAPNGWAPLQWVAVQGLRRYGYHELADKIRGNFMNSVEMVFEMRQKLIEKYAVEGDSREGGGGEYPLQDGFGWTNGVYAALHDNFTID